MADGQLQAGGRARRAGFAVRLAVLCPVAVRALQDEGHLGGAAARGFGEDQPGQRVRDGVAVPVGGAPETSVPGALRVVQQFQQGRVGLGGEAHHTSHSTGSSITVPLCGTGRELRSHVREIAI
ncbi:hypothetical protein ACFQXA_35915 [Nocardiopsis composta]